MRREHGLGGIGNSDWEFAVGGEDSVYTRMSDISFFKTLAALPTQVGTHVG